MKIERDPYDILSAQQAAGYENRTGPGEFMISLSVIMSNPVSS